MIGSGPRTAMRLAAAAAVLLLLLEQPLEAYIDPGAGSMLLQLLLGGAMAGLVFMRSGLRRVLGWFRRPPGERRAE